MAPLPKSKHSTRRKGRRTKKRQDEKSFSELVICKECGKNKRPHQRCKYCGK